MSPRTLDLAPEQARGISAFPAATAMVWPGVGKPHTAVAVPGVRLAPGDVLVAVELATICPDDLRAVSGEDPSEPPLVLGHEQVGTIVAFGEGGARSAGGKRLQLGQRVVWSRTAACGHCAACRRGLPQHCAAPQVYGRERMRRGWELSGAFASHAHLRAGTTIVPVPKDVPAAVLAPASCAAATAVAALEAAAQLVPLAGELVVVFGTGLLGLSAVAMAKDADAIVVVLDSDGAGRARARAFGADAVADPRAASRDSLSFAAAVRRVARRGTAVRIALELSGTAAGVGALLPLLGPTGVLVLTSSGRSGDALPFDAHELADRELAVRGVSGALPRQLELAVGYLADAWHHRPFADCVSEPLPLAEIDRGLELAMSGVHARVAITP